MNFFEKETNEIKEHKLNFEENNERINELQDNFNNGMKNYEENTETMNELQEEITYGNKYYEGNIETINELHENYYESTKYYEEKIKEYENYKAKSTEQMNNLINELYAENNENIATQIENSYFEKIAHNNESNERKTISKCRSENIFEKLKLEKCSNEEKIYIKEICSQFPLQFYLDGDILGHTEIIQHSIKLLPNTKTINVRQYRIPHVHKKILQDMITDYENQGIIEKCQSPFNSPAILVSKKDENNGKTDHRFVVDYRKLNEASEMFSFPIPLIDDILDGLSGCKIFTTLDIKGAFHQLTLEEDSRNYTAFTAGNFQYRWIRMPMGLSAAPLTWQRAINTILANLIGNGVYVYLDDVIVYAKDIDEHNKTLKKVMLCLKDNNLQLKISICNFFAKKFEYLGHVISDKGIKANPMKIEAIF